MSKLPYYFLGADYADFKNSICIVRVIPRNPRLILQHNEVVIYFIKKETATAGQYTFMDYIKVGLPLQIIMGVVMVFVLPLLFPF